LYNSLSSQKESDERVRKAMEERDPITRARKAAVREGHMETASSHEPIMPVSQIAGDQFSYVKYTSRK
jgi:hypothetical protein